jgi:hypothetical protein
MTMHDNNINNIKEEERRRKVVEAQMKRALHKIDKAKKKNKSKISYTAPSGKCEWCDDNHVPSVVLRTLREQGIRVYVKYNWLWGCDTITLRWDEKRPRERLY